MVIKEVDKASRPYRMVAVLNMATFVAFRIVLVAWMSVFTAMNRHALPTYYVVLAFVGFGTLSGMNLTMLLQIVGKDFLGKKKGAAEAPSGKNALNGTNKSTKED